MTYTPQERREASRAYNWTVFWFCLICAGIIGGGLLWAKNAEENRETDCTYYPGPDGAWGTADDTKVPAWPGAYCPE